LAKIPAVPRSSYGSWPSPIGAAQVAQAGVRLSEPALGEDGAAWWLERRPLAGGRTTLVRDGEDVTPVSFDVRTRVHEYGGGAWLLHGETAFFSNFDDQRLYRLDPGGEPAPLTPEGPFRYADARATPGGDIVCVRETHGGDGEPVDEVVRVPGRGGEPEVVASGRDFYASPRVHPDGEALCWLAWDHPNMPWDGCELQLEGRRVAGGRAESIWQPEWSPAGELHWVSDRDGWWNLYREGQQLTRERADLGHPLWLFGGSTYAFLEDGTLACVRTERAVERLCLLREWRLEELDLPYTTFGFPFLRSRGHRLVFIAGAPDRAPELVTWSAGEGARVLRRASDEPPAPGLVSVPRPIEFESAAGRTAHAFYYPPAHPDQEGPPDERPPLLVQIHGGPTGHAPMGLDEEILFWTSRGVGVVDVNHGGSTGFGREYRNLLRGAWGVVDVEDCVAAARHLADQHEVDGERLAIHGGSAGGYTTLAALVFRPEVFAAGTSYYGVADVETLGRDTHKFESRYMDGLIAPYPEEAETWRERSPIHFADRIRVPVLLLQGLEDAVVPPSQAEQMVEALKRSGIPHAYLAFAGEEHGFRRSETIVRALEAELSFYGQVLGFEPAGEIQEVTLWTR
jgi:dipeptidyl aminopeptidase/acylaminoacyl peptidase